LFFGEAQEFNVFIKELNDKFSSAELNNYFTELNDAVTSYNPKVLKSALAMYPALIAHYSDSLKPG
jgi:hypothetical protein